MKITDLNTCIKMANDYLKYEREKASQRGNEDYVAGYMACTRVYRAINRT